MLVQDRKPVGAATDAPAERSLAQRVTGRRGRLAIRLATVVVTVAFTYVALNGIDLDKAWKGLQGSDFWWLIPALGAFGPAAVGPGVLAVPLAACAAILVISEDRPLRFLLGPLERHTRFSAERLERTVAELAHGLSGLHNRRVAFEALVWTVAAWLCS